MGIPQMEPLNIIAEDWDDYKRITGELSENWVFRGQVNADWELRNALERTNFIQHTKGIEQKFLMEFQRGARNYLNRDETPEHIIEWLALMQHHGAPTRLVDFSKSPFISSYFAFEQCWESTDYVAIWALNVHHIRKAASAILAERFPKEWASSGGHINEQIFEKIFFLDEISFVFPVEPFRMNRRYSIQQSIFLSSGISTCPFMDQLMFLGADISKSVIRIDVPTHDQKRVIRDLQKMNIHRASLFPDLDGYALSMKMKYDYMKTPEESLEDHIRMMNDRRFDINP